MQLTAVFRRTAPWFVLPVLLAACGNGGGSGDDADGTVYKFGVLAPLTGPDAVNGATQKKGVDLAIEHVNASNLLHGGKLEAIFADNQADPTVTVSAFNQLIRVNKVPVSLTSYSGPTLAIAPIAERTRTPLINIGAVTPELADASHYLFNAVPLVSEQALAATNYAVHERDAHRIALYYSSNDLGKGTEKLFESLVDKAGGTFVGSVAFDPKSTEYRATLSKLSSLHPDAVFVTSTANQTGNIIHQAASQGFHTIWMGYQSFGHKATLEVGGADAEGGLYTTTSTIDPTTHTTYPATEEFESEFHKKYGDSEAIDYTVYSNYQAVQLLAHAIAGLVEQHKKVDGENLRQALMATTDFSSVLGPLSFHTDGTVLVPLAIREIRDGTFVDAKIYTVDDLKKLD